MSERTPLLAGGKVNALPLPSELSTSRKTLILGALWLSVFLGAADTTCVATLVTSISSSFQASNQASWLGTSYLLTLAAFTPTYGRLCDIYGRRIANTIALILFGVGTLGCGLAPSMNWLIVARCVAGLGAGGMMSVSSIVASDLVPLKKRGLIQGVANLFYGLGAGIGGPLGGFLSDRVGWRAAFLIQVPVVCLSITLVSFLLYYRVPGQDESRKPSLSRIDWAGSFTLIVAVATLLLAMSFKTNELKAWSDAAVWAPLIVSVIFLALFIYVEARISKEPVMPIRLVTQKSPLANLGVNFFNSACAFVMLYFYPMFFEAVMLTTSSQAGLRLIPNSIALSVGSLGAGIIMRSTGKFWWLNLFSAACPLITMLALTQLTEKSSTFEQWFDVVPGGISIGSCTTTALIGLISCVSREDIAVSTAMSYLFRYTGQVVGVALASSIMQSLLTSQLSRRIVGPGAAELIDSIRHQTSVVHTLPANLQYEAVESYKAALHGVYWFGAGCALLAALCALLVEEKPLPGSFEEEQKRPAEASVADE